MHTAAAISRCFESPTGANGFDRHDFRLAVKIDIRHARALRQSDKGGSDW